MPIGYFAGAVVRGMCRGAKNQKKSKKKNVLLQGWIYRKVKSTEFGHGINKLSSL